MPRTRLLAAALILTTAATAGAQERRRGGDPTAMPAQPAAPPQLPQIPYDAARPFAGVWEGQFTPGDGESVPLIVVVEFLNGAWSGYQMINNATQPAPLRSVAVVGDTLRWEMPNSGGGFLVYSARLISRHALGGAMGFRDLPFEPRPGNPTFSLRRRGAPRP